jgi:SAM-dependent methyltransferase
MKLQEDFLVRVRSTLHSPDRFRRMSDFAAAKVLLALPPSLRAQIFKGSQRFCPICQSPLRTFLTLHRPYHAWCPVCWSLPRHRLVWLLFQRKTDLFDPRSKRVLHIAPEPALSARLRRMPQINYLSADLLNAEAMVKMDLTAIQYPADSFDVVYCSHVLEHIADDRAAIREMRRVLSPSGWALILVPITADVTSETSASEDPIERERLFGQIDHVRRYGRDFASRLEEAGFKTTCLVAGDIVAQPDVTRFGLSGKDVMFYCTQ